MPFGIRAAFCAFVVSISIGIAPHPAASQPAGFQSRLDSLFTTLGSNQRMMGSVTIRKANRVLYHRTLGYRDSTAAGWVPCDDRTAFRIGSVTKPFTAVMIYQLIDEKRLSLDTKVSKFFPKLAGGDSVTVRDLLGHTSGLADYSRGMDPMVALDRDALLARIAGPLQFKPGTQRRYNNSNFLLLGFILEHVTGSTYEKELQQRIVKRVALANTHFGEAVDPAANHARGYFFNLGHWEIQPEHAIQNAGGAGGIASTTDDLTRFLADLFQGRLISGASLQEMTHGFDDGKRKSGKGLGPFTIPGTEKTGFSHDGSIGAHAALVGHVPDDSLSLALTINGYNYPMNRIFFSVWGILYGTKAPLPSFAAVKLDDATATSFAGDYTSDAYGLTITIRRAGAAMEGQTKGDPKPFPLAYVGRNRFVFERDGILLEFVPPAGGASSQFTLYQQMYAIPLTRVP